MFGLFPQDGEHGFLRAERHPVRVVPGAVLLPGGVPVSERVVRHAHGGPHPPLHTRDRLPPDRTQETRRAHPRLPEQHPHVGLVQEVQTGQCCIPNRTCQCVRQKH